MLAVPFLRILQCNIPYVPFEFGVIASRGQTPAASACRCLRKAILALARLLTCLRRLPIDTYRVERPPERPFLFRPLLEMGWCVSYEVLFDKNVWGMWEDSEVEFALEQRGICDFQVLHLRDEEQNAAVVCVYAGAFYGHQTFLEVLEVIWKLYNVSMKYRRWRVKHTPETAAFTDFDPQMASQSCEA